MTQGLFDVPFEAGLPFSQVSLIAFGRTWMSLVETDLPFPNAVKQTTTVKVPTAHVQLISIQIQLLKTFLKSS